VPSKVSLKLLPSFLFIIFLAVVPTLWFSSHVAKDLYYRQARSELENINSIISSQVVLHLSTGHVKKLADYIGKLALVPSQRLTIIDMDGKVVFDTSENCQSMDNHAGRQEVHQALLGIPAQSIRYSHTLKKKMLYFAEPLIDHGVEIGVLRSARAVDEISGVLTLLYVKVVLFGFMMALFCTLLSTYLIRKIALPLSRLQRGVKSFAEGDFKKLIAVASDDEIGEVAKSVNQMGQQLQESLMEISNHNRESKAILSSMREGVLAVTKELKLIRLNRSACKYLNVGDFKPGSNFESVVVDQRLIAFVKKVIVQQKFFSEDCIIYGEQEKLLHLNGTPLLNEHQDVSGAVVIINDVTHVRELENIRQDFVANVSHELRTPIAILKSTVETLEDGAIEDPKISQRFLKILSKNTNRLELLIEDILFLSKVEDRNSSVLFTEVNVSDLVHESIGSCQDKANRKDIVLESVVDRELCWSLNESLVVQALINLIENGIKYSGGTLVKVLVSVETGLLNLAVIDYGVGIDCEEFDRIFERFYRVDKSHSNKVEGTGLGLSIVKHIAGVHHGRIELESEVGKGSRFTLVLPVN
jgi:two-component system phosphate regulon sensor histidine kinase PhoR